MEASLRDVSLRLPGEGAPADIAPAEAARPVDKVDGVVGAFLCFRHGLAERRDIQHAAALGEQPAIAAALRAGMEDRDARQCSSFIEPADFAALGIAAG